MKILFVASVYNHLIAFHIPYMKKLKRSGYEVICIAQSHSEDEEALTKMGFTCYSIPFNRNPWSSDNLKAFFKISKYLKERRKLIKFIHVHTPIAAFITRLAAKKNRIPIIYTAHGFHFFKGAPLKNWLIYYPLEYIAAPWTRQLITLNKEDYFRAKRMKFKDDGVNLVHGVGVEDPKPNITLYQKESLKKSLNLPLDTFVISYIAELNHNKNHIFIIDNWKKIKYENPSATLLIIGSGDNEKDIRNVIAEENLKGIHLLGYRNDIPDLLKITDLVCLLSYREGLPKSIMEAMSEKIPCVVTNTRGLRDLIDHDKSGYIINQNDNEKLIASISILIKNKNLRDEMGEIAFKNIQPYKFNNVVNEYQVIYNKLL